MKKIEFEHAGLIQKVAWSFHLTTGLDFEDLVSEALLAYQTGIENYDPKRGAITTFMWHHISNKLNEYVKKERRFLFTHQTIDEMDFPNDSSPLFEKLTPEAQEIAKIVLSHSSKFAVAPKSSVYSTITRILQIRGWNTQKINRGFHSIEVAFSR